MSRMFVGARSNSMLAISLVRLFEISLDNPRRFLSLSFLGLPGQSPFRQSPLAFYFLITKATVDFGMFNSLDMSLKYNCHFYDIQQLHPSRSHAALDFVACNVNAISNTIFKYKRGGVDMKSRYTHLHGCANTHW
ncbi:hypothetical protein TNCV_4996441 [Trichonephila clavipes]|nr:hypothetical protein TNCV_4996441 [Trichonephila clavipes]